VLAANGLTALRALVDLPKWEGKPDAKDQTVDGLAANGAGALYRLVGQDTTYVRRKHKIASQ